MKYGYYIKNLVIDGKVVNYGVVNEHAVRAGSGIMFTFGFATLLNTIYTHNLYLVLIAVSIYFLDFCLKVFFGPKYSFFYQFGNLLVFYKKPEYVGALQKRFAWAIGLVFSFIVLSLLSFKVYTGAHQIMMHEMSNLNLQFGDIPPLSHLGLPFYLCVICLILMWLEAVLGFCVVYIL
jgi:hypothetical protein